MIISRPLYQLALVELEALTPHGVHSGEAGMSHDVMLVRDANGLPALPATSIAGVLRHLARKELGEGTMRSLFGYAEEERGEASRVTVTWGLIHDSRNRPVETLLEVPESDALLRRLLDPHPLVRQRVRLNARGAADDRGKFDTTLIPAGARYSLLLRYQCESEEDLADWNRLLALLAHPAFRIGHGTRAGAGNFRVNRLCGRGWDLTDPEQARDFVNRPRTRMACRQLPTLAVADRADAVPVLEWTLRAEQGLRIGGGERSLDPHSSDAPDLLPQSEPVIEWNGDSGSLSRKPRAVLPATAIKGALAHRVAWHYRRLRGEWVESAGKPEESTDCPAVQSLFGTASDEGVGHVGAVVIDDIYPEDVRVAHRMHNRIDRFTGGVITGGLFEEEMLWRTCFTLRLKIVQLPGVPIEPDARQALALALDDLGRGWLPIGAGASRDLGSLQAEEAPNWSDGGAWLRGETSMEVGQ